ncbi:efflux RND transporter periplasmic adaptor subunit [Solitalea sp. MAHUQ-68]|uniref:Efflux RND transporter periplasmic adaptor subunit n=1 Tax=Solitalea agri TaxID=2953739 RepID=A0A9X2JCN3_9SPHI|nr:efflux RND transporter periplasmic adaptor subunit [Solitalea agri]MCO4291985.1 efflux RND transporter periplasmic adaptor subunit [Solitalea agri]
MTFLFLSCNRKKEIITPEVKNITESVYASGIIKSENQYEVYTKANGIVNRIAVKEGDYVKKGQLLFRIENPNAKLSVDNARLNAEVNDYYTNSEKLKEAYNSIQLALKNLSNDSLVFERQKMLWNQNIGSKVELEQKELAFEKSKVTLMQARVNYDDLKRQLYLAYQQSQNNLKIAQTFEKDMEILSALEGIVYKIDIKEGELATVASPLAVIGEEKFVIELNIDEFDIVKITKGQKVIIRLDAYKSQTFSAVILSIYPMMNERTRTFKVKAVFTQEPKVLYPNLTLEASIIINKKQHALTIPTRFLLSDSTVMLENETLKKVKIGLSDYNLTEIKSGITANSKIIIPKK